MKLFCVGYCRFPRGHSGKESACQCRRCRRHRFNPWVGKIPWRKKWQSTPVFLPGESHGQRILAGYSPWGHKESDMTATEYACPCGLHYLLNLCFEKSTGVFSPQFIPGCLTWVLAHLAAFSSSSFPAKPAFSCCLYLLWIQFLQPPLTSQVAQW